MKNTMRRILAIILTVALLFTLPCILTSCSEQVEYRDYTFFEMDTYVVIRLARIGTLGYLSDDYLESVANHCDELLVELDGALSCHNEESKLYSLNGEISMMLGVDPYLLTTLATADKLATLTNGAYDYTLGALTELWNVTGGGPVPSDSAITDALSHCGRDKFTIDGTTVKKADKEAKIDLGGIGKGMATQILLEYLATTDVTYGLVSVGGNIGIHGTKPEYGTYKIGLRDPDDASGVVGYWFLSSGFVSVSGDYERYFEANGKRYHHILNPQTGYPADSGVRSVAVHSSNGALADALSTALFVLGVNKTLELYKSDILDFEAIFITNDGEIVTTPGVKSDFMLTSESYTLGK